MPFAMGWMTFLPAMLAMFVLVLALVLLWLAIVPGWRAAQRTGIPLGPVQILAMRCRGTNPTVIIGLTSRALSARLRVLPGQIELQHRRTGRADRVVTALIKLQQLGVTVTWEDLCVIDSAGRDVMDVVEKCGEIKTIPVPTPELMAHIQAVAQDGIELCIRAELVCQIHNVTRLMHGFPSEVLVARTGTAIIEDVGAAATHTEVLADLDGMVNRILAQRLDEGCAFEIVELRIVHAVVGRDIGAMYRNGEL